MENLEIIGFEVQDELPDGYYVMEYRFKGKTGYKCTIGDSRDLSSYDIDELINKPHISECCPYLQTLIKETLSTDNGMVFVEDDDEDYLNYIKDNPDGLDDLSVEVDKFDLDLCLRFDEDDCPITVYGGIITKFLF